MIFRLFIFIILFLLKTNDEKRNLDESDFRYCYCNFFECHYESYAITALFKVLSQELWSVLTTAFWKAPYNWRFYGHGKTNVLILSWRLQKTWNENQRRCLEHYKLHKNMFLHFEQHCTKIGLVQGENYSWHY